MGTYDQGEPSHIDTPFLDGIFIVWKSPISDNLKRSQIPMVHFTFKERVSAYF